MEKVNKLDFAAINPVLVSHIPNMEEIEYKGRNLVYWGVHNDVPNYLYELYKSVPTLQSAINNATDFVCGDDIRIDETLFRNGVVNQNGETIYSFCHSLIRDYWNYGGFAINVVRNQLGNICNLNYVDIKKLRSDKKNTVFYYSSDWTKGRRASIEYEAFNPLRNQPSSIYLFKNTKTETYPIPVFGSALISCEIEKSIDEYHLNAINNGFTGSYIISMNNGQPEEEQKDEIEKLINEKFSGYQNAARILVAFNDDKEHGIEVQKLDIEDYGEHYKSLAERSLQEILTSFRMPKVILGNYQEGTGFNSQDYAQAYKMYSRIAITPVQRQLADSFQFIFGKTVLSITPFKINWSDEGDNNEKTII